MVSPQSWDPNLYPIGGRPTILIEVDQTAPVVAGNANFNRGVIDVAWSGDDSLGSGIENYDVSVSIDGSPPLPWVRELDSETARFDSEDAHSYTFYITARDRAGNVSQPYVIELGKLSE